MYLALGIVFLAVLLVVLGLLIYLFIHTIVVDRELVSKKNLFYIAPSFLIGYSLYLIAASFNGQSLNFFYCVSLINDALDLFVFKPEISLIQNIAAEYPIYYADFIIVSLLSSASVILSVISFFSLRLKNYFVKQKLFRHNCDIVIGVSPSSLKYARRNKNTVVWATNIDRDTYEKIMKDGIPVLRSKLEAKQLLRKIKKGEHHLIAFNDIKTSYNQLIDVFAEIKSSTNNFLFLHLEVQTDEIKVIKEKFIHPQQSIGAYITCFNSYELAAREFVYNYPMSKFIPRSFYEPNCAIKKDKELNVAFIGFGKVNYRLFSMASMQFQFAQCVGGKIQSKPVHYYIFDNNENCLHNEFFSKILYEFDENFAHTDFPKPDKICDLIPPMKMDVNSVKAKETFKSLVNKDSFTYFIISLDDDLIDSAYAQTIKRLLGDERNYQIFVRAKNGNCSVLNESNDGIIYFGDEKDIYSRESIVNESLTDIAMKINLIYDSTTKDAASWVDKNLSAQQNKDQLLQKLADPNNRQLMLNKWEELDVIMQFSNIYHALNIPFKLGLMGMGLASSDKAGDKAVSKDKYFEKYVNPCIEKGYDNYSGYFNVYSSNVLAFIEHARWNAFYVLSDYTQMNKKRLLARKYVNKHGALDFKRGDPETKQHACLTSYYGLNDVVRCMYADLYADGNENCQIDDTDRNLLSVSGIYNFDYMSLDSLFDKLLTLGLQIVDLD